jgi:uncharacterized NAD(P)/FAD-binding protein YdhS
MEIETLNAIVSSHLKECEKREIRYTHLFDEIKLYFKGIWDTIDENKREDKEEKETIKNDLKKLEIRAAMFFGGLLALKSVFDYLILGHK